MGRNSAQFALTSAAFLCGLGVGAWLTRPREAPRRRSYDREAAQIAQEAKERSVGLNWFVDNFLDNLGGRDGGSTGN